MAHDGHGDYTINQYGEIVYDPKPIPAYIPFHGLPLSAKIRYVSEEILLIILLTLLYAGVGMLILFYALQHEPWRSYIFSGADALQKWASLFRDYFTKR